MKKFKYRLQKLLDAKFAKEREIQYELAKVVAEQNKLKLKQDDYKSKIADQKKSFHDRIIGGESVINDLVMFQRFADFADKAIITYQKEMDAMLPKINEIRGRLTEAMKERKTIEKHKEKKLDEWKKIVSRAEEKISDDINQKIAYRNFLHEKESGYTYDSDYSYARYDE
jgi:flagellar protein FliJ